MAIQILVSDVTAVCPTTLSDCAIQTYIDLVNGADACFDANGVPCSTVKSLKIWAVCHMITMSSGGQAKSERDMDGASVTYSDVNDVGGLGGLGSTSFGQMVKSTDLYGCITSIIDAPQNVATMSVVGGSCE